MPISEAILITGGLGTESESGWGLGSSESAELFLPWKNSTCQLPPLPRGERYYHFQYGNLLCGGGFWSSIRRSCIQWNVQKGDWVRLPLNLTEKRLGSSVWRVSQDNSLVIMGGKDDAASETSEIVSSDRDNTRSSFKMRYPTK